ncbi:hypothetical protein HUT16_23510 [Kitasatospora sp. NA04385]|uniref:hypothetical protein n=1 Tax=Kitasatospora sp. NA04385 TaxID=2742135 RepID=UPI00159211E7|nr:hypothetical protein [Kitasatospora sp. NA04385]QKW21631.1 hypothetical protein HUT16_23510 [Kitasatospora sp. NA04385]
MSDALRQRAWEIAEQLARTGGGEARLTVTPDGRYRIELDDLRPHGTDDHRAVLDALALGDRWGHRYSPPSRNGGTARETVWSEVRRDPPALSG